MKKPLLFFLLVIVVFIGYYLIKHFSFKTNYTILGSDISNQFKGILNWEKLEGINSFIILRAVRCVDTNKIKGQHSYVCKVDSNFKKNWYDLENNKLIRGAYHRYSPGVSPNIQFEIFKNHVNLGKNNLPPILDIQQIQNNKFEINLAIEWLKQANNLYHKNPILYLDYSSYLTIKSKNWVNESNRNFFDQVYLLLKSKEKPDIDRCIFWQFDYNREIKGFQEKVDIIAFTGDSILFKNILIQ